MLGAWEAHSNGFSAGYRTAIRYMAAFSVGIAYLVFFKLEMERLFAGADEIAIFAWVACICCVGWKRHWS